jgi:hypothetical protein
MRAFTTLTIALLVVGYSSGCATVSSREFSVSNWKSATTKERRLMADDFLKKYETKEMTVTQIKELLGEPDFGSDVWRYDLNLDGSPIIGPQGNKSDLPNQYFWVMFRGLYVDELSVTNRQDLKDGLEFDSSLWKASKPQSKVKMVASLMSGEILKGRSKGEVRQILGDPNKESDKREIEYNLGLRIIDYVTLTFTLDAEKKVSEAKIFEH